MLLFLINRKFKRILLQMEIFSNIINILPVTFDQLNASMLYATLNFFQIIYCIIYVILYSCLCIKYVTPV